MKRLCTVFAVLFFTFTAAGLLLAQSDPFVGPGSSTLQNRSLIRVQRRRVRRELGMPPGKSASRASTRPESPWRTDTPSKMTAKTIPRWGPSQRGTDRLHQANERHKVEANFTRDGKHAETATFSVSKDGRVLSILAKNQPGGRQALYQRYRLGKAVRGFARKTRR